MSEKQKKLAIIIGTIVIAVFLLLSSKKGGTTIVNQQGAAPIDVSIPSLNLPSRGDIILNIPGLPSGSVYDYNAISPCMCNGAAAVPTYNSPLVEIVNNLGSSGPNIYNNSLIDSRNDGIPGNADAIYAATGSYFYSPPRGY